MPLTRDQAIEIARRAAAGPNQPSYYAEPFDPDEWVIDAIVDAAATPADREVDVREHCHNTSPRWFTGHWRDWHRGHECSLDDGKPRSAVAQSAIEAGMAAELRAARRRANGGR